MDCLFRAGHGNPLREKDEYKLHPFHIDLSSRVPRMLDQIQHTELPKQPVYVNKGTAQGIGLSELKSLQTEWLTRFDWEHEQDELNKFNHYTAQIEGLEIHFIHQKSKAPGAQAIPLLLLHGWPGSFLEFVPIINNLTEKATTAAGKNVSFDVIVPSLPGYAFSSVPPVEWTVSDTARVFDTLLTKVLGYNTYAAFGTDWGGGIAYTMYNQFSTTLRAAHLTFLPFLPLTAKQLAVENITLSPLEEFELAITEEWSSSGSGYWVEQATKPNTIGLALHDNPVGQLAWIGEKFLNWSDPNAGHAPSVLTNNEILRSVSLYYLTETFASSVLIYAQNPNAPYTVYTKANTNAPLLFSAFKYNVAFWPPAMVAKVGNLVRYQSRSFVFVYL
ncbi:hypothetical protein N7532_002943 [Penicillium argentinense]|uniref:Epoxide hydrolase N-terminal domain-containing protein n=1 Tax=Penicillium argentinense TaxID=1131581 RepID=A0A9W9G1L1_9EURO|nr:uncharacterized protein N7532_002943 [Penicillium argentinense]KAJ5110298.1 hypothetical protein N7532_002943 [Penicillium argentinense]